MSCLADPEKQSHDKILETGDGIKIISKGRDHDFNLESGDELKITSNVPDHDLIVFPTEEMKITSKQLDHDLIVEATGDTKIISEQNTEIGDWMQIVSKEPHHDFIIELGDKMKLKAKQIRIASHFILQAPPGEFTEVFNDVRIIFNDDDLLKEVFLRSFARYNKNQLTPVDILGSNFSGLISDHNDLGDGRFCDPRSKQSFLYNHLLKKAIDFKPWKPNIYAEIYRRALEKACTHYTQDHYVKGTCCVFSSSKKKKITLTACIESHTFQPKYFWNGSWRSSWSVNFVPNSSTAVLIGLAKVQVHYFEGNGDVKLESSKKFKETLSITTEQQTANEFMKIVEEAETKYQMAICEKYHAEFETLRRSLPQIKTRMNWTKFYQYKIGSELKRR